ncbi:MAG: SDR family NAD(P)-dependent oxidoreductase [Candidatus Dormibacteria bacterium]
MSPRAIVTGAASGIGAATTAALLAAGVSVVGLDLRSGKDILQCDVRDQASVDRAVTEATRRLGGLDILVNNAGVGDPQGTGDRPGEDALKVIDVNLFGPWRVTAAALPALRASRGRVINVASGLVFISVPMGAAYIMAKHGLVAYSDALRLEHGDAISVTTVYPGYIRTPIHAAPAAAGFSLDGMVPVESLDDAAATLVRAALGRRRRNLATTTTGSVAYAALRLIPRALVDGVVVRRFRARGLKVGLGDPAKARDFAARVPPRLRSSRPGDA